MISFEKNLNNKECLELIKQSHQQQIEYIKNYFITWAKKEKIDVSTFEKHLEKEDLDIFSQQNIKTKQQGEYLCQNIKSL